MAHRERRPATWPDRHGGLDRVDPGRGDPQLRPAGGRERGDVSHRPRRHLANPEKHAVDPVIHLITAWDGLPLCVREWHAAEWHAADWHAADWQGDDPQ